MRSISWFTVFAVFFVFLTINADWSNGKEFTRCGLAQELIKRKFTRTYIGNWICMIQAESRRNTTAVNVQPDGSQNLGLFQINNKGWCTPNKKGGNCNMACEDLINDDISDDSECVLKYFQQNGFKVWNGWNRFCYNQPEAVKMPRCS